MKGKHFLLHQANQIESIEHDHFFVTSEKSNRIIERSKSTQLCKGLFTPTVSSSVDAQKGIIACELSRSDRVLAMMLENRSQNHSKHHFDLIFALSLGQKCALFQ